MDFSMTMTTGHNSGGHRFRVIPGGLRREVRLGALRVVAAPDFARPFPVEAMVLEEDTYLVLSATPKIATPEVPPVRLMTELLDFTPETPGSVVVKGQSPVRLLAVVIDVDEDPICQETWIERSLEKVFHLVDTRGIRSLGLQMLGTLHGRIPATRFVRILSGVLGDVKIDLLERLWIDAPIKINGEVARTLQIGCQPS